MTIIDLYTGFEIDSEIIFREKTLSGDNVTEVHLWYGYFVDIMSLIPLSETMHQDSVTYNWQKGTGFYNYQEWECKRVQEFNDQLISISSNIESDFQEAYNALKLICHSTLQNSNKLYIEYL
ncbi:hypothetical protein [Mucilaginibacter sp. HD30]